MKRRNAGDDREVLARLEAIVEPLRQIPSRDAAYVLADGMSSAGIAPNEGLQLIAAIERILGESARPEKA